jgi:hypothetical protein
VPRADAVVAAAGAADRKPVVRSAVAAETGEVPIEIALALGRRAVFRTRLDVLVDAIRGTALAAVAKADVEPVAPEAFALGERCTTAKLSENEQRESDANHGLHASVTLALTT